MKFKGTLWLILVLAGLVLYTVLVEVPTVKKEDAEKKRSEKILLFEMPEVEAIDLVQPNQTLHIQRRDTDAWEITKQGMTTTPTTNSIHGRRQGPIQ